MAVTTMNWSNVTDMQGVLVGANTVSNGWFWAGINFMIFFVILLSTLNFGFEASMLVSAFIGFLIALMLAYLSLVAWWVVGVFVGIILFMIMYMAWNRND